MARILSGGKVDAYGLDWAKLRYEDTQRLRQVLAERYSPRTANFTLSALRGVLKECWRLKLMSHAGYARAIDIARVRVDDRMTGRVLKADELAALVCTCEADDSPAGVRDSAIVEIMYSTGLRRAELTDLDIKDYGPADGVMTVKGKGNRTRLAYLVGHPRNAVNKWLATRGVQSGPLFVAVNKGGGLGDGRLTGGAILQILRKRAAQAGVDAFSPHDLRRTTATTLLERGVDLAVVQKVLGHADVSTTVIYDRRGEKAKREAALVLESGAPHNNNSN
jgi:site-specific recombinase XerD